jgi:hypothetical protein
METGIVTGNTPIEPSPGVCACCGRMDRKVRARLACHDEIGVCGPCLLWLNKQALGLHRRRRR